MMKCWNKGMVISHNSRNNFILYQNVHMQCILPTYDSLPSLWTTAAVLAKKSNA